MIARKQLTYFLLVALMASAASSQLLADPPRKNVSIEGITEYELDNGLKLLLFPDPSRPTVTVNMTVLVGSRHEGAGEGGMAHLLEHMLFKGTPTHSNIPQLLKEKGAQFNGTTSDDRTNYFETLPASDENLEFALNLEADRLVNSYIKGEDLQSEMTVVRNEFENSENSVVRVLLQRIQSAAYEWHNYGKPTIGNRSDIERVPITKLRDFYRKYYQPDNVVLVIAGQFDEQKALELVQKYFGAIPRPDRVLEKTYTEEPPQDGERTVVLRRVGDLPLVGMAYHIPAGAHPDYAPIEVLAYILASEPAGRMYKALVETQLAANVYGFSSPQHDPGLFQVLVEIRDKENVDKVRSVLEQLVEEIGKSGVSQEDVDRAKQQILKEYELAQANSSRLAVSLSNWAAQGDWRLYLLFRDRIEEVTPEDVHRVAAHYLTKNNRTVGIYVPSEERQRVEIPAVNNLREVVSNYKGREAVTVGEAFDVSPQNIESRTKRDTLPGGLRLAFLPKKTRASVVHLDLTLRYGNADNLKGLETAAELLPTLMLRGTRQLTYQQLQDELDKNRATINGSGTAGSASFNVQTKRENLVAVLRLLQQVLREPLLPADELEILRRQELAGLEQQKTEPHVLAGRQLRRLITPYPSDHVLYVPTIEEDIERAEAVTHEQIEKLYDQYLGGQTGELAIVGDFDLDEIRPLLAEILADWNAKQPYARIEQTYFPQVSATRKSLLTPDKANAAYYGGLGLPIRDDAPDYAALVIGNFILGGGSLSSRLGDRVRQQEGLSYGIGSSLNASSFDNAGRLIIGAIANPENIPKVTTVIQEELELLLRDGVKQDELDTAITGYLQEQKVRRTSDNALAGILANTLYTGRTMQYYSDLENAIQSLSTDRVSKALDKYVQLKRFVVVSAGDFQRSETKTSDTKASETKASETKASETKASKTKAGQQ